MHMVELFLGILCFSPPQPNLLHNGVWTYGVPFLIASAFWICFAGIQDLLLLLRRLVFHAECSGQRAARQVRGVRRVSRQIRSLKSNDMLSTSAIQSSRYAFSSSHLTLVSMPPLGAVSLFVVSFQGHNTPFGDVLKRNRKEHLFPLFFWGGGGGGSKS